MLHEQPAAGVVPAASPETDIRIAGLRKGFNGHGILNGVNLEIKHGQSVALIGANGTGKSTLLRCCLRLIDADGGTVQLLGRDITGLNRRALRRVRAQIGMVFQRHNLVPRLKVLTNVIHGAQSRRAGPTVWLHSLAAETTRREAMRCLEMVGLNKLADRRADQLSGGQSQRVAIARALMQHPKIMLADEPVASLDPSAGEEVMSLFVELIRREGLTLFFTSHNLDHAVTYAERVVGLRSGVIELDEPSDRVDPVSLKDIYE